MLWWNLRKAKKMGLVPKRTVSGRNWKQSILFYCEQCDSMFSTANSGRMKLTV